LKECFDRISSDGISKKTLKYQPAGKEIAEDL
jgi:hypothetical protein